MAVTYTSTPQYLDMCNGDLHALFNGGTYNSEQFTTGTVTPGRVGAYYYENLAALSSACKLTRITLTGECRAYVSAFWSNAYVTFDAQGLVRNNDSYVDFGGGYKNFHKRYCDASSWGGFTVTFDSSATCNQLGSDYYVNLRFQGHNYTVKRKAELRNLKLSYTRTRACYITFKGDGVTEKTITYDYNTVPSYGSTPTRDGYNFKGWSNGSTTYSGTLPTAYETDVTYTAVWERTAAPFTVNFNGNGATSGSVASFSQDAEVDFTLPANGFLKQYTVTYNPGYSGSNVATARSSATFKGWEDHGSITAHTGETFDYTQFDAPYYANKYTDIYNAFKYNKRSLVNHYVDNGRNEGRSCTGSPRGVYPEKATVNSIADDGGSTTLYAQWSDMSAVTLITPSRDGYSFLGWYTAAEGGTKVGDGGASYTPSGNITLYAHWKLNEITDIYIGTSILDVYIGTTKLDVYQGKTKIYG